MTQKAETPAVDGLESDASAPSEPRWEAARERFWEIVEQIRARNAVTDPDEVYREVTEVVEEVRQEMYEEELRAKGGC
jgi:hypothetical protein